MLASDVPAPLAGRLGPEGTNGLLEILERTGEESVTAAMAACTDRFERRLVETGSALRLEMAGLRQEIRGGFAALWSFLFWVGQVAVVAGLFGVLLRAIT